MKEIMQNGRGFLDGRERVQELIEKDPKLYFFIQGNTGEKSSTKQSVGIYFAKINKKLSVINPDANGRILSLLGESLKDYNALPSNAPFVHKYITDYGVKLSSR